MCTIASPGSHVMSWAVGWEEHGVLAALGGSRWHGDVATEEKFVR